jgi:hypothetical protein
MIIKNILYCTKVDLLPFCKEQTGYFEINKIIIRLSKAVNLFEIELCLEGNKSLSTKIITFDYYKFKKLISKNIIINMLNLIIKSGTIFILDIYKKSVYDNNVIRSFEVYV